MASSQMVFSLALMIIAVAAVAAGFIWIWRKVQHRRRMEARRLRREKEKLVWDSLRTK